MGERLQLHKVVLRDQINIVHLSQALSPGRALLVLHVLGHRQGGQPHHGQQWGDDV